MHKLMKDCLVSKSEQLSISFSGLINKVTGNKQLQSNASDTLDNINFRSEHMLFTGIVFSFDVGLLS